MRTKIVIGFSALACVWLLAMVVRAQQPTSRVIPFQGVATTIAPSTPGQALTIQLWDAAATPPGTLLFSEAQTLDVDATGAISFVFGSRTENGLDPANFPSGASRFLDVVDSTGASVLPTPPGRIALNAQAFALSPGPQGPQGQQGPPGTQGPPGVVQAVSPGDTSVSIGGTAANPTVAVASGGITTAKLAANAVTSANLAVPLALSGSTGGAGSIIQATNSGNGQGLSGFATAANGGIGVFGAGLIGVHGTSTAANFGIGVAGDGGTGATGVSGSGQTGVFGSSSAPNGFGVSGNATGSGGTGVTGSGGSGGTGVTGSGFTGVSGSSSANGGSGVRGNATGMSGVGVSGNATGGGGTGVTGVGVSGNAPGGIGVRGTASSGIGVSGNGGIGVQGNGPIGVFGIDTTGGGAGGQFQAFNGVTANILFGLDGLFRLQFRVDSTGKVFANGGFQTGGADFAESVEAQGERSAYEPGDVLVIDHTAARRVALSQQRYSTLVAGIYSTKPGVLATPHEMDDPRLAKEIPLAMVGIVPCKVSTENGPIHRGDLLVSSSTPGYAMRGTDRSRMLGAVVAKALEALPNGKGVIQVLVTLQ